MRAAKVAGGLLLASLSAVAALLVVLPAFGYHHYVITSGSMTGTYDRGSIVLDRDVPTASLQVGDVITYMPPPSSGVNHLVTHRIFSVEQGAEGRVFRTKGDANPSADPWTFNLTSPVQPRVATHLPWAGYLIGYLSQPRLRVLLVGLPAAALAVSLLVGLWRDAGQELRENAAISP